MLRIKKYGIAVLALVVAAATVVSASSKKPPEKQAFELPDTSVMETGSNRHAQFEEAALSGKRVENRLTTEGFEKKMETGELEVWFREEIDSIRVVDKRSGYIWGSLTQDEPENLNQDWAAMANSLCTVEYFDKKSKEKKASLSGSSVTSKYKWNESTLNCSVSLKKENISFSFTMTAEGDSLRFTVDEGSVLEEGESKLKALYFVPFLGCTLTDEIDGYMFVPDGPGALMRYQKSSQYIAAFEKKIYGSDMGIDQLSEANDLMANRTNDFMVDAPQVTMPVFGVVHGAYQNAVLAVVEGGEEYASILATPAGVVSDYNWVTARFDYRQMYMHPTGKDGVGVYRPQEASNQVKPIISYRFLTGERADYSGMAVCYRDMLLEQGALGNERQDADMPLLLNILGSDVKKQFLMNSQTAFTTFAQADEIVNRLKEQGAANLTLRYEGWQKGGVNGSQYGTTAHEGKLGSWQELQALQKSVEEQGGRFLLGVNPVTATSDQMNPAFLAATTFSKTIAKFVRPNTNVMYYERFVLRPRQAAEMLESNAKALGDIPFAVSEMGSRLYSDQTRGKEISRSETKALFQETLQKLSGRGITVGTPNRYLWDCVSEYTDMPMVNSQYLFETDTVPFLQIVLKGSMDCYAPYANQGFYSVNSILKMVEYGVCPSFIVGAAENSELKNTPQEDLFSINFNDWEGTILSVYEKVGSALNTVEGKRIKEHRMAAPGVARVTYEGGAVIYVNYNSEAFQGDGVTVPGLGFLTKGGAS